jgi:hypothetical protein
VRVELAAPGGTTGVIARTLVALGFNEVAP